MAHAEALNSGGKPCLLVAKINDGTGETLTIDAAATPEVVASATLFVTALDNTGGLLTFDGTTGVVTVAKAEGIGSYKVSAIVGDGIGTNAAVIDIEIWAVVAGAAAAQIGQGARKTEPATAARQAIAPAFAIFSPTLVSDTVEVRVRVGTNGHTLVVRDFTLIVEKVA